MFGVWCRTQWNEHLAKVPLLVTPIPQFTWCTSACHRLAVRTLPAVHGALFVGNRVRLPQEELTSDDFGCMKFLIENHGVAVLPTSSCGLPGHLRVCFANLEGARLVLGVLSGMESSFGHLRLVLLVVGTKKHFDGSRQV